MSFPINPNDPHVGGEFHGFDAERVKQIEQKQQESDLYVPPSSPSNPANMNKPGFIPQTASENERRAVQAKKGMTITDDGVTPATRVTAANPQVQRAHMTPEQRAVAAGVDAKQPVTIPPAIHPAAQVVVHPQAVRAPQTPVSAPQAVPVPTAHMVESEAPESESVYSETHVTREQAESRNESIQQVMDKNAFPAQPKRPEVLHSAEGTTQIPIDAAPYRARAEGEAVSIDLPSRFHFYDFKDLYVKPFRNRQLGKIARASAERSVVPMVEAVSSVLTTSTGDTDIAFKLTIPDYYFVMHWLRHESYTKFAFTHHDLCTSERHVTMVEAGTKSVETLRVSEIINKTRLKVFMLDRAPDPTEFVLGSPYITLRPALVSDMLEIANEPRMGDPEFGWMAEAASYITIHTQDERGVRPMTIAEKVDFLFDDDSVGPDDVQVILAWGKTLDWYGVQETIRMRCKECGASWDSSISLEAHSFLSAA